MQNIYVIDNKGKFRASFNNIRDAKSFAFHERLNNYYIKRVEPKTFQQAS